MRHITYFQTIKEKQTTTNSVMQHLKVVGDPVAFKDLEVLIVRLFQISLKISLAILVEAAQGEQAIEVMT